MGFFTNLINRSKDEILSAYGRFTHKGFLEAALAASYMVGIADGSFDADEKAKMSAFIKAHPAFKGFRPDDIMGAFNKIDANYTLDRSWGDLAGEKILKGVVDPEEKEAIVYLTCMIGAADGNFDAAEKKVVTRICSLLHVPTSIHPAIEG